MSFLAKLSRGFLPGLSLLTSTVCYSYDNYHWQAGFPTPLAGPGAELVSQQTRYLLQQRRHLQQRLTESQPMIRWVEQQVRTRKLPTMLALLPLIESSYRLDVVSSAGAAGPWQLMPDTAARFSVPMTTGFDGRYSLPLATEAALTYLGWLHQFFGQDWLLALAAYNAGEGRVLKAVLHGGTRNLWALQLPTETRLYVARFIALSQLLDRAAQHGFVQGCLHERGEPLEPRLAPARRPGCERLPHCLWRGQGASPQQTGRTASAGSGRVAGEPARPPAAATGQGAGHGAGGDQAGTDAGSAGAGAGPPSAGAMKQWRQWLSTGARSMAGSAQRAP